jgi:threonine dehydrogenase-like Zn-dependent dehydrogenase
LPYQAEAFFYGSLAEPMSCIIGSFKEFFHVKPGVHKHEMGIKEGGTLAILAGAGPMGLGAIDYAIHCDCKPSRIIVTDIDNDRLKRAENLLHPDEASKNGVELIYINTSELENPADNLILNNGGKGFDDVLVMAPVREVVELGDRILGTDGCTSFFAGPTNTEFSAEVNFYNIHYGSTHIIGTVGGNSEDMLECITMAEKGYIDPSVMITHVGGLDASADATLTLPKIPGGKKLIYTQISLKLTAISDFEKEGKSNPLFARLAEIIVNNNGLWCLEAEKFLLSHAKSI